MEKEISKFYLKNGDNVYIILEIIYKILKTVKINIYFTLKL